MPARDKSRGPTGAVAATSTTSDISVGDVDEAQSLGEPGKRDDGAVKTLRRLMAAAHRRLRAAVEVEDDVANLTDCYREDLVEYDVSIICV